MKKLIFLITFLGVFFSFANAQEEIHLQPCVKLCVVMYSDNSGSMDSATTDIHRWARGMTLVPAESGYVEVGLYSFDASYDEWCSPTGNKETLLDAVKEFCRFGQLGGTSPSHGLKYLNTLLSYRKARDPAEIQVVLIHSDYYWDDSEVAISEIKKLLDFGVTIILSIPKAYDGTRINDTQMTNDANYEFIEGLGCKGIRSNFGKFKSILGSFEPKVPCG